MKNKIQTMKSLTIGFVVAGWLCAGLAIILANSSNMQELLGWGAVFFIFSALATAVLFTDPADWGN